MVKMTVGDVLEFFVTMKQNNGAKLVDDFFNYLKKAQERLDEPEAPEVPVASQIELI